MKSEKLDINAYNILLIIACYFIANLIFTPVQPDVKAYFNADPEAVKACMTYFQIGAVISCFVGGLFADFIGKKTYLVCGLIFSIIGTLVCLTAYSIGMLIIGRFLQGGGVATGFMMGFALAVDLYVKKETLRIIAINGIFAALVSIFTPYLGGVISHTYNWQATFLFLLPILILVLAVSILNLPPECNTRKHYSNIKSSLLDFVRVGIDVRYLSYASLNAFYFIGLSFSLTFLPFYYRSHFDLPSNYIGLIIGIAIFLTFGVASVLSVFFYEKLGTDKTIFLSILLGCVGAAGLLLAPYLYLPPLLSSIIPMALYFYSFGSTYTGSIVKAMGIFPDHTTVASSIRTIMLSLFSFVGALIANFVSEMELFNLGLIYAITLFLSFTVFLLRGEKKPGEL